MFICQQIQTYGLLPEIILVTDTTYLKQQQKPLICMSFAIPMTVHKTNAKYIRQKNLRHGILKNVLSARKKNVLQSAQFFSLFSSKKYTSKKIPKSALTRLSDPCKMQSSVK